jgi:D-alanyl-D-alanine carboxypeptidase
MIRVSVNAASQRPCTLRLQAGQSISVKNAILAIITKSANDVAVALAEHLGGGSESAFVDMMNKEARRLGMRSTVFFNPSGWKNPQQLTTVGDIGKLARALQMEYPSYYYLFRTRLFVYNNRKFKNHNELLGNRDGMDIDGIKTGFLNSSGFNLAASASRGKNRLIVVVFGGKTPRQRDAFVSLLLRKGFSRLSKGRRPHSMKKKIYGGIYNKIYGPIAQNRRIEVAQHKTN